MTKKFEQDKAIETLRKAAKTVRAPKLDEGILEKASLSTTKPNLLSRMRFSRRATQFTFAGVFASLASVAIVAGSTLSPQTNFTLELGAAGPQSSGKIALGDTMMPGTKDMAYWPNPISIDYVAGDGLSDSSGNGAIYEFANSQSAQELSSAIKRVLGIAGDFATETYDLQTLNGLQQAKYLNLHAGSIYVFINDSTGALSFNYSNGEAWVMGECVREETSPETPDVSYCAENAPVKASLPSNKEAIARALEIFEGLGFETTANEINITRSTDSLYAFAPIKVDGKPTGLSWDISWGNSGKISSINGYAVDAIKVADVSTISAKDTVERMSDSRWMASGSAELYADAESVVSSGARDLGSSEAGETREIRVVRAKETLGIIYDVNGKMFSVPSYAMYAESDSYPLVIVSVVDGVIKLREPIVWLQDDMVEPEVNVGLTD